MLSSVLLLGCSGASDESTSPTPPDVENQASFPGAYAQDFLRSTPYDRLIVEVDVVEGAEPDPATLQTLVDTIDALCNKPGGTQLLFPDDVIPSTGAGQRLTSEDVDALELEYRDHYRGDDTAVMYFLFVDGHSDQDTDSTQVVGYAYHASSMVIFMEVVNDRPPALASLLEKTVTVHELGHILGLVDLGTEMVTDHRDPDHGRHCNNEECMMYWLNNSTSVIDVLSGTIPSFDDNCLSDIAAAGGKDARGRPLPM